MDSFWRLHTNILEKELKIYIDIIYNTGVLFHLVLDSYAFAMAMIWCNEANMSFPACGVICFYKHPEKQWLFDHECAFKLVIQGHLSTEQSIWWGRYTKEMAISHRLECTRTFIIAAIRHYVSGGIRRDRRWIEERCCCMDAWMEYKFSKLYHLVSPEDRHRGGWLSCLYIKGCSV